MDWIKLVDSLPDIGKNVLVRKGSPGSQIYQARLEVDEGGVWWVTPDGKRFTKSFMNHWMSLPAEPANDRENENAELRDKKHRMFGGASNHTLDELIKMLVPVFDKEIPRIRRQSRYQTLYYMFNRFHAAVGTTEFGSPDNAREFWYIMHGCAARAFELNNLLVDEHNKEKESEAVLKVVDVGENSIEVESTDESPMSGIGGDQGDQVAGVSFEKLKHDDDQ